MANDDWLFELMDTRVFRGGVSQKAIHKETNKVLVNGSVKGLDLRFRLRSAGGGKTSVLLRIGPGGMAQLLSEIARSEMTTPGRVPLSETLAEASEQVKELEERAVQAKKSSRPLKSVE